MNSNNIFKQKKIETIRDKYFECYLNIYNNLEFVYGIPPKKP